MPINSLSDDDFDRLARHLSGEGTPVERSDTERWVHADEARRQVLEEMRAAWRPVPVQQSWDVDAAWQKMSAQLTSSATPVGAPALQLRVKRRWWQDGARLMQAAAVLVVLAGGAMLASRMRTSGETTVATVAPTEFATGAGERTTVTLDDGSTVVLGAASTLRVRSGFGQGAREVELDGEGLFTVDHDEARPFRVLVAGTIVEDLGTEFAIRSYAPSAVDSGETAQPTHVRVAVTSGSVAVRRGTTADTAVVLAPRDVATVGSAGEVAVSRGIDVTPFTAFAAGRLIFVDTPLSDVAAELERWYGLEVRITDPALFDRHLTSTFEGESVDEVLRIIGMTLDVRYVHTGNRVDFTGKRGLSVIRSPLPSSLAEAGA